MQTTQTDLVITGAHTAQPGVFWKGQAVQGLTGLKVIAGVVTLTLPEDPLLAEMRDAGIKIVRA